MSDSFECHVPCPLDTCTIVVEHVRGPRDVAWDGHSTRVKTASDISGCNCEFAAHVGCGDFSFAGAERRSRLTLRFPAQWVIHAEYDGATHAVKFEEGDGSPFAYRLSNLRSPVGVSVSGESVRLFGSGSHCICECLEVGFVRLVKEGVHGKLGFRGERDAIVMGGVNVLKSVKSTLHVSRSWAVDVRRKKGVNCCEAWTSHLDEQTDAAHETLVSMSAVLLSG